MIEPEIVVQSAKPFMMFSSVTWGFIAIITAAVIALISIIISCILVCEAIKAKK
jgi:hypothetical protein